MKRTSGRRKKILVVDDDLTFVMLLRGKLENAGFDVDEVHFGKEALDRIAARPYDLVLLDVQMPDVRGHEVCQHVRRIPRLRKLPIFIITAFQNRAAEFFKGEGANEVMYKPLNFEELRRTMDRYLNPPDLD